MNLLKQFKNELFFWKEMLRYGYWHPIYWWRYFRNKFFYGSMINNIGKIIYEPDPDFELHVLICRRDIWILIWSLKSFLYFSELKPQIILHDDGSLDEGIIRIIKRIFPQINILKRKEAERKLENFPEYSDLIKKYREDGHVMTIKLIDVIFLSSGKYIMTLDSDILFFRKPQLIIDFVAGKLPYDAMISGVPGKGGFEIFVDAEYIKKHNLDRNHLSSMNAGLVIFRKDSITCGMLLEYLQNVKLPPENYFVEMTAWACLMGQVNHMLLSPDTYILKGKIKPDTIMKHFTSPRRHELYAYGLDLVKLKMKNEK